MQQMIGDDMIKLICKMSLFAMVISLISCVTGVSLQKYGKNDFVKLENRNFPFTRVTLVYSAFEGNNDMGDSQYKIDSPLLSEQCIKGLPYDEIGLILSKRYGVTVDASLFKKQLEKNTDWGFSAFDRVIVSTGEKRGVSVLIFLQPMRLVNKIGSTNYYILRYTCGFYLYGDDKTILAKEEFKVTTSDPFNTINGQIVEEHDVARYDQVRKHAADLILDGIKKKLPEWKKETEEDLAEEMTEN
jgi:hypothetical protein